MRALVLVAVVASAGLARADGSGTEWPKGQRLQLHDTDPPDDPPMSAFATRTSFYLMRLGDDGAPRCEEWATRPGKHLKDGDDPNHGRLVHDALAVDYHSAGIRLETCGYSALVHEEASGNELDVDGARWFRDPQKCSAAIAKHRAVATDFRACLTPPPSQKAIDAARARFRAVFGKGGTLWVRADDSCRVATATVEGGHGRIVIDDSMGPRTETYDFNSAGDTLADVDAEIAPELGDGTIKILDATFYIEAAGCRTVIAVEQRRASWLPKPP